MEKKRMAAVRSAPVSEFFEALGNRIRKKSRAPNNAAIKKLNQTPAAALIPIQSCRSRPEEVQRNS
jgi:hypothetical protein